MKNKKWRYLMVVLGFSMLTACGGGSDGGAGPGEGTGPAARSEGTLSSPVLLTASTPHNGTVSSSDASMSYYMYSGLAPGATYSITLSNISGSVIAFFFSSTTQDNGQSCFYGALSSTSSCIVQASTTGAVFIALGNYSLSGSSSYTISMALATDAGQGTPTAPVAIASPATASGTLTSGVSTTTRDTGNSGYYRLTGLTAGHRYRIELTPSSGDADLLTYQSSYANQACRASQAGGSASCTVTAKGNSLLLQVRAKDQASYTISHTDYGPVPPFPMRGSAAAPTELTLDPPTSEPGSVNDTKSYYTVTRLVPGQSYYTSLTILDDNIDLYVYRDGAYSQQACASTNPDAKSESCIATADSAGQLWFVVDGSRAQADLGSYFHIVVRRVAPPQGSSATPQLISHAELPFRITRDAGMSYYKLTGLAPNTPMLVTAAPAVGADSGLGIYTSGSYSPLSDTCTNSQIYDACGGTTNAAGELYIGYKGPVDSFTGSMAYLNVKAAPTSQGTATAPLVKDMAALGKQFMGTVAGGSGAYSYYELKGLTPNTPYYVLASFGADDQSAQTKLYTAFTGNLETQTTVCEQTWSYLNNGCTATADASGKMWVGIGGWSTSAGTVFKLEALPVPIDQGTQGAPLNITASLPYRGSVAGDSQSWYMVTNLTAGSEYLFSKDNTSADATLTVWNDSGLISQVCATNSVGRTATCRGKPTGSTVYLHVNNIGYRSPPGYYSLDVTPVPVAEGSPTAPIALTSVGSRTGSVNVGASYYRATLAPNTRYTISLTSVNGDPDLYVYNAAAMSGAASCRSINGKNRTESCQATSDSNGNLWITVDGQLSSYGASYQLQIN